jgi:hypothetical protein
MQPRQLSLPTGVSSDSGKLLRCLKDAGEFVSGDAIYIEVWTYQNGAYLKRSLWGVAEHKPGTTAGFFLRCRPLDAANSKMAAVEYVNYSTIGHFTLFELKAATQTDL